MKVLKNIAFIYIITCICITIYFCINQKKNNLINYDSDSKFLLEYVNACMAIANAILLYATLTFQGRTFRQERFETTFFHLLDNHRKLINEIRFKVEKWDWNFYKYEAYIEGYDIFTYAVTEVTYIKKLICETDYPTMDDLTFQDSIADIENKKDYTSPPDGMAFYNEDKQLIIQKYELWKRTNIYNINEDKWNICKLNKGRNNENASKMAYAIFYEKMKSYYDIYFSSLSLILKHIGNAGYFDRIEKSNYKDYIMKQLSYNEQNIVKLHCKYDNTFYKTIKDISIQNKWYNQIISILNVRFDC